MMRKLNNDQLVKTLTKIQTTNDNFIVLLDTTTDKTMPASICNANIYCIDDRDEIIWQIDAEQTSFDRDPFVSLGFKDQKLVAKRFFGFIYEIDISNGKAKQIAWEK